MKNVRLGRRVNLYHEPIPLEQILKEEREGLHIRKVQPELEKHGNMAVLGMSVPVQNSTLCR